MHRGDNNTFVDDKMATNSSPAIHLHLLVIPSATLILGWPWDMLWAMGHWQHDTGRGAEKCLCGGACPELLSEPCERRCVNSLLTHDSQVSVTGLDVQQHSYMTAVVSSSRSTPPFGTRGPPANIL